MNNIENHTNDFYNETNEPTYAGFWIRVLASFIDFIVLIPILGLQVFNLIQIKNLAFAIGLLVVQLLYKPLMEYQFGATLGKLALKINVVNEDFEGMTLTQSFVRYAPWLIQHAVGLVNTVLLYTNHEFLAESDFFKMATIQEQNIDPLYGYVTGVLLLISCIIVGFNSHKQGLHDKIAKTYCIIRD
jgi:uncharacterized RDD family membrane protein YckC